MQVEERYDLVVVGDQISGFFLAAGAAQAGLKVLMIEGSVTSTAMYEVPSGNFLTDLVWEPLIGLSENSKLHNFFHSLGLYQDPEELFPLFSPSVQMISPDARFDYFYDSEKQFQEFDREFPQKSALLKEWNKKITTHQGNFATTLEQVGLGVEWERFGALQMALYGAYLPKNLQSSTYRALSKGAAEGVRYPVGGRAALKERLLGRLQVFGGKLKRNTWVEEIVFEKGKLAGVLLSSFEGFVRSSQVIGAMGAKNFFSLIPKEFQSKKLKKELNSIQPRYWRMSYTIKLPESAIPEGFTEHSCIHDFSLEPELENFLQVLALPRSVYGGIAPNQRILLVRLLIPFEEKTLETQFISAVLKRSIKNLEKYIPNLRKNIIAITPNANNLQDDAIFKKCFSFPSLRHIPPSYLVYEKALNNAQENTMASDWSPYGLAGIALCSRDVHPLYGLMGEAFSAMELLDSIHAKQVEKK